MIGFKPVKNRGKVEFYTHVESTMPSHFVLRLKVLAMATVYRHCIPVQHSPHHVPSSSSVILAFAHKSSDFPDAPMLSSAFIVVCMCCDLTDTCFLLHHIVTNARSPITWAPNCLVMAVVIGMVTLCSQTALEFWRFVGGASGVVKFCLWIPLPSLRKHP